MESALIFQINDEKQKVTIFVTHNKKKVWGATGRLVSTGVEIQQLFLVDFLFF